MEAIEKIVNTKYTHIILPNKEKSEYRPQSYGVSLFTLSSTQTSGKIMSAYFWQVGVMTIIYMICEYLWGIMLQAPC